jgi:hypothetical protein
LTRQLFIWTILITLTVSCGQPVSKSDNTPTRTESQSKAVLSGIGESGIAGYYNDWTIKLLENNAIQMLCSMKEDSLDTRKMNRQYFGHIVSSNIYSYKVIIDKAIYVDDCDEPGHSYQANENDTIPFYIDSALFKEIKYWDLAIQRLDKKDTTIRISNSFYPFYANNDKDLRMTLIPEKESGYYPVSIRTGKKCAVVIGTYKPEMDYYLNKAGDDFKLITDITPYVNMQNKKCDYCLKEVNLKVVK